jgi:hypothetical protein
LLLPLLLAALQWAFYADEHSTWSSFFPLES